MRRIVADSPRRVHEELYQDLLRAIRGGRIAPGEKILPERELAEKYSISVGSVQAALKRLVADGMIVRRTGAGSFVRDPRREEKSTLKISAECGLMENWQTFNVYRGILDQYAGSQQNVQICRQNCESDIRSTSTNGIGLAGREFLPLDSEKVKSLGCSEEAMSLYTIGGNLYASPMYYSPMVLYFNKDIFDAGGMSYPDESWGWDALLEATERLTDFNAGHFGLVPPATLYDTHHFVFQNGGEMFVDNGRTCTIDAPEVIEAFSFCRQLNRLSPTRSYFQDINDWEVFLQGSAAMTYAHGILAGELQKRRGFRWGVTQLPRGRRRNTVWLSIGLGIHRDCQCPDMAWEYIRAATGPGSMQKLAAAGLRIPAGKAARQSDALDSFLQGEAEHARRRLEGWEHCSMGVYMYCEKLIEPLFKSEIPVNIIAARLKAAVDAFLVSQHQSAHNILP